MRKVEEVNGQPADMVSLRLWIRRRVRLRYVLLLGILLAVLYTTRSVVNKLDESSISPDDSTSFRYNRARGGKTLLRRGPKVKDELHLGYVNHHGKLPDAPRAQKVELHPGEQILRDNVLDEAFEIPTSPKITTEKPPQTTPKPRQRSPLEKPKLIRDSILDLQKITNPRKNEEKNDFPSRKEDLVPNNKNSNIDNGKMEVHDDKGKGEMQLRGGIPNDNQEVDIDSRALRVAKTNPPWLKTVKPMRVEDYRKNCSAGSIPLPGSSFHTEKFCLIDDSHEYFGLYDKQLCYHRGTNNHETRRRIKKHHTCECHRGWHGKYCSMPDVVFNGKYPYEYGVEVQVPPRRIMFAFPFNGEFAMLETIMHSLHNVVDVFLILESNYTAAGQTKERELLTKLKNKYLQEFQYKVVYISLDYFPRGAYSNGWVIDGLLRNHIGDTAFGSILENVRDNDIIVSTDADEIMTEETLMFLKLHYGYPEPFGFTMKHTVFGYFWQAPDKVTNAYGGCSVALYRELLHGRLYDVRNAVKNVAKDERTMRDFKRRTGIKVNPWTFGSEVLPAGWHCSWCFLPPGIRTKLISAHASDFPRWGTFEDKTNLPFITNLVKSGTWFDEKTQLNAVYEFGEAPRYVRDNEKLYGYLLDHAVYMNQSQKYLHSKSASGGLNPNARVNLEGRR